MNFIHLVAAVLFFLVAFLYAFMTSQTNIYDYLIAVINAISGIAFLIAGRKNHLREKSVQEQ